MLKSTHHPDQTTAPVCPDVLLALDSSTGVGAMHLAPTPAPRFVAYVYGRSKPSLRPVVDDRPMPEWVK